MLFTYITDAKLRSRIFLKLLNTPFSVLCGVLLKNLKTMSNTNSDISIVFNAFKRLLEKDQELTEEIKHIVKNLEEAERKIVTTLQTVHNRGGVAKISISCNQSREIIESEVKPHFEKLGKLLTSNLANQYYKYHENWRFICQKMTFVVALIVYLEAEELVSHEDVANTLGIQSSREKGFHLDLEDYLTGLLQLPSELSRLAVSSVIYGDYKRPFQISDFITELNAGYQLLNLKNDFLRKRFDALKYDVKKIEEVVYDLSIRGLKPVVNDL